MLEFGESLHVGADVAPPAGALDAAGARGGAALSRGNVRDGVSAADVVEYLQIAASHNISERSVTGLATYPEAKVVTLVVTRGPQTRTRFSRFALLAQDAVEVINTALPLSYCQMLCMAVLSSAASLPVSFSFTPLMNLTSVITSAR